MTQPSKTWFTDVLLLCLLIGSCFAFMLPNRPLSVPDEARYAEIPREMLVSHDFITPRINGIPYFEKPPLVYWMQAASLKTFGLNEEAARLPTALMALLGCLATYFTARKLYDRRTGIFAALILSTSLLYFTLARVVTLDMITSVLLSLALFSFILGVKMNPRYYYLTYIFSALTVLSKGLIGIIFPGSIIFIWLLLTRHWKILTQCRLFTGTLIFLAIAIPWHIMVQRHNPEFFHYYFIKQQFSRYFTNIAGRNEPLWFFTSILLLGLFPWTGLLVGTWQTLTKTSSEHIKSSNLYFLILFLFIFIFFSLSHSQLVPYILPCFPALAILMGQYCADNTKTQSSLISNSVITSLICISLIIGLTIFITPSIAINYTHANIGRWVLIGLLLTNIIILLKYNKNFMGLFIGQFIITVLFLGSLCVIIPSIYMDSVKPLVVDIKKDINKNNKNTINTVIIASYHFYYQDLPFYLNRTISIVDWQGELAFGENYISKNSPYLITDRQLWQDWNNPHKTVYLIIPNNFYANLNLKKKSYYRLAANRQNTVLTNHPGTKPE